MAKKRKGEPVSGWVILDKPAGLGSTTAVSIVKRIFNAQKAGHAGTLDPAASGVLPIALGEATKTIPYVTDGEKTYAFTVRFGQATDTDDAEGRVIRTTDKIPSENKILSVLPLFCGEIDQVPPKYSAVHINGQRAYDLARENKEVTLAARRIRIEELKMLHFSKDGTAEFQVRCSKGTYVRSLARDMAEKLGSLGHVTALRRLKCAKFSDQNAFSLEYLRSIEHSSIWTGVLLPVETVLDDIPALAVTQAQAFKLSNGNFLPVSDFGFVPDADVFQAKSDNRLIALVRVQDGMIRPVRLIVQ
ncbi:MAG: tRNA pseudouridine(55) synthase TruB [Alphaproteobacteria bacterium]